MTYPIPALLSASVMTMAMVKGEKHIMTGPPCAAEGLV
jgi:hypothetical protein